MRMWDRQHDRKKLKMPRAHRTVSWRGTNTGEQTTDATSRYLATVGRQATRKEARQRRNLPARSRAKLRIGGIDRRRWERAIRSRRRYRRASKQPDWRERVQLHGSVSTVEANPAQWYQSAQASCLRTWQCRRRASNKSHHGRLVVLGERT